MLAIAQVKKAVDLEGGKRLLFKPGNDPIPTRLSLIDNKKLSQIVGAGYPRPYP